MKGAVPARDAHVIARLRAAGAIVLAKTNMSDWLGRSRAGGGSSIAGQVVNPYDLTRTVAPSSSGVGASMAAWFAAAGIGSETGTSIRNPTTDGSLVGLAPTEGLIGRSGAMANTFTHERLGPMARSTFDVAVMLDHMIGIDGERPRHGAVAAASARRVVHDVPESRGPARRAHRDLARDVPQRAAARGRPGARRAARSSSCTRPARSSRPGRARHRSRSARAC